ncbi:MAG: hypothetical protein ABFD69_15665 [Candidatus Sumerlaeia bacterium]
MWLHNAYRQALSEGTRARIRSSCRRVMPGFFEKMRRGVIGEAADAVPPASAAMTPPPARYDELYFARRNPLIQSIVRRVETGEALNSVLTGFDATAFDERVLYLAVCADWLREFDSGAELLDFSGAAASKMLNTALAEKCGRVCFANMDDSTSTVMRTWSDSRWNDGYQRFPEAYRFDGAMGMWCRPRKQFNLVLSGFTIPGKNALLLNRPIADVCKAMHDSLGPGGRMLLCVAGEQADPDAVGLALTIMAAQGVTMEEQWYAADTNGWHPAPQPGRAPAPGDGEPTIAAVIRGVKE